MRAFLVIAAALLAPVAFATGKHLQTVDAARIVAAARAEVSSPAASNGMAIDAQVIGTPTAAVVQAGKLTLGARKPAGRWPRSRVAVPVAISVNGSQVRVETVWFAVTATRSAWVYGRDAERGLAAARTRTRRGQVDIAALRGHPVNSLGELAGLRLRRSVRAGSAVVIEDFEPTPDVDVRQKVEVLAHYRTIDLRTRGVALSAGDTGQMVSVLADGGVSPVQARVQAKGVVQIAQ